MANLKQAHQQLFQRSLDDSFESVAELARHCREQQEKSSDRWHLPQTLISRPQNGSLQLEIGSDGSFLMNDWSFTQLCSLARVNKDTVNRLSPDTASLVFRETLPAGKKPLQLLTCGDAVRSIHGVSYTRLWHTDLLAVIEEFATDFQPPQRAVTGHTGLYAGEQDMFCFLIDPTGWAEIGDQAFAPGVFFWNSEVGRRSVGISTFWFQAVCANHLVWDATEVADFTRKHTANVHDALAGIRQTMEQLVRLRDARKDGFVRVIKKAMEANAGADSEESQKLLLKSGINRTLANKALQIAQEQGAFTIFSLVDALTRIAREHSNAGERLEADQNAAALLSTIA